MAKPKVKGLGTRVKPWLLKTPSGSSEFQMYRDETADPPKSSLRPNVSRLPSRLVFFIQGFCYGSTSSDTPDEFNAFLERDIAEYAAEKLKAGNWSSAEALCVFSCQCHSL